jgi:FAD/FMN-containing dehydrogenase
METAFERELVTDAVIAESLAQSRALWHVRESISLAQAEEGAHLKHDISLPISAIPLFVDEIDRVLQQQFAGIRIVNFGHLGDGNLHYNIQAGVTDKDGGELSRVQARITRTVYDSVASFGGTFSAEHGIGSLKLGELQDYKPAAAVRLMRKLKDVLDPGNVLNPGRALPLG